MGLAQPGGRILRAGRAVAALVGALVAACGRPAPVGQAYLFEKGGYQAIYEPGGRLLRLLQDGNGDRRADVSIIYGAGGTPERVESDLDGDGAVDRWEVFGPRGLEKLGSARRSRGQVDLWETIEGERVVRRELDDDGDHRFERDELWDATGLVSVALDTNGDGRMDRWQQWQARVLRSEAIDLDGDGRADRRLEFAPDGRFQRLARVVSEH